ELPLDVGHLERRPVDVPAVERDVEILRKPRVVRVDDRAARHERQRRLGVVLDADAPLGELERLDGNSAEDHRPEPLDLLRKHVGRTLDGAQSRDGAKWSVRVPSGPPMPPPMPFPRARAASWRASTPSQPIRSSAMSSIFA